MARYQLTAMERRVDRTGRTSHRRSSRGLVPVSPFPPLPATAINYTPTSSHRVDQGVGNVKKDLAIFVKPIVNREDGIAASFSKQQSSQSQAAPPPPTPAAESSSQPAKRGRPEEFDEEYDSDGEPQPKARKVGSQEGPKPSQGRLRSALPARRAPYKVRLFCLDLEGSGVD